MIPKAVLDKLTVTAVRVGAEQQQFDAKKQHSS